MALVLVRIVRSDDKSFILGTGAWRIISKGLKGIDFPNFSVYPEKNGVGAGSLIAGKRIDDRDIQIDCRSTDPRSNQTLRDATITFFNPEYTFRLYITYMGVTKWIEAELQGFSCPSENINRPMSLTVKFYCADPFLKSVDDFGQDIALINAGFGFPYIEVKDPLIPVFASTYGYNQEVVLTNDGDTMTYPRVTVNFHGMTVNPKIYKNDYFVRILDTFQDGDVLELDFDNGIVYKNGVNWTQHTDRASNFTEMGLGKGDSTMGYAADDGDGNMAVFIYYNKRYLGL